MTVLDNLSTGFPENVLYGELVRMDLSQVTELSDLLREKKFDACLHFAASTSVFESVQTPEKYFRNNTVNTLNLVNACIENRVKNFIFSSTAAVYGESSVGVVREVDSKLPINPYGESKLMSEMMLRSMASGTSLNYAILRYFNVAGADPDLKIGQRTENATHLIKIAAECAVGKREKLLIYGDDYSTADGTCERDYIHVVDLAEAHLCALDYLVKNNSSITVNCGYSKSSSVKNVVAAVKEYCGVDFPVEITKRRTGDPARLVANADKIMETLSWQPKYDTLEQIVKSAVDWERMI